MLIKQIKNILKGTVPRHAIELLWHLPNAILANLVYGFPAKTMTTLAVAGTKGKSTTCHLLMHILEQAGNKVAMISTTTIKVAGDEKLNNAKMTTPSAWHLQKFYRAAKQAGCNYAILEVSSHALRQHRVWGIPFNTVLLTNLMPDHLEYHGTAEDYQQSHRALLTPSIQRLIINGDDPCLDPWKKILAPLILFHQNSETALWLQHLKCPMPGKFNFPKALAAATCALDLGINRQAIKTALENPGVVPGRMENINKGQPFTIMVDYAHSPDSLKALFSAIGGSAFGGEALKITSPQPSPWKGEGVEQSLSFSKERLGEVLPPRTICVFGACGERDARARPPMGKILDENCDIIIVTNDDPYGEDPEKIAADLMSGINRKQCLDVRHPNIHPPALYKIMDRHEAIKTALSLAQSGDLVLVLGKGAEQWQVFRDKKVPWDDRKVVRELLSGVIAKPTQVG